MINTMYLAKIPAKSGDHTVKLSAAAAVAKGTVVDGVDPEIHLWMLPGPEVEATVRVVGDQEPVAKDPTDQLAFLHTVDGGSTGWRVLHVFAVMPKIAMASGLALPPDHGLRKV